MFESCVIRVTCIPFLWPPLLLERPWDGMGRPLCFTAVVSLFSSFFLFSSPILSGRRLDVYHASGHDVALVQI